MLFLFPGAIVPLMKDPFKVLNYDSWWRKDFHNILMHVIPAVNEDITQKVEVQLEDSLNGMFSVWLMDKKLTYFLMEPETTQSSSKESLH